MPSYEVAADTRFAPQALSDLLARSGAEFCGEKIPFDLNGEQAGEKTHGMSYAGISTAVMLPFGLKGKTYICHAFSNPPYPYVRPTVFDDLFADELAFLQTNLSGKRKLGKKDAVALFSRYARQPNEVNNALWGGAIGAGVGNAIGHDGESTAYGAAAGILGGYYGGSYLWR